MKLKTKLKRKRKEWMNWLFDNTDPVNGNINEKFEGIIDHALEEHSDESILEERKRNIEKIDQLEEFLLVTLDEDKGKLSGMSLQEISNHFEICRKDINSVPHDNHEQEKKK